MEKVRQRIVQNAQNREFLNGTHNPAMAIAFVNALPTKRR